MKYAITSLMALAFFSTAQAQIVPDTLDNRRYFPLEVGNEWHYTSIAFISPIPSYQRLKIVADTIADGKRYFKSQSEWFNASFNLEHKGTSWLRYNAAGAVFAFSDLEADTTSNDSATFWYHADFGDTLETGHGFEIVGGTYDTSIVFPGAISVALLFAPQELSSGEMNPQNYGLGWRNANVLYTDFNGEPRSFRVVHHEGQSGGSSAFLLMFLEQKLVVAMMTNINHGEEFRSTAYQVAKAFLLHPDE
jgi:hypothetical protein